jgi:WD40 repeat protein
VPYLVSEFVQGVTLEDLLSARRPTPREVAQLIAAVADALQYAHEMGVVHRDVKPANIMLEESGIGNQESGRSTASAPRFLIPNSRFLIPKLMDFGLAKRDAGEITMTLDGTVLGTPAYMSPEQARGEAHKVDGRSDVYSLGVVLYQLLTGELPFRGTARMLLHQVLHDEPRRPRSLNDRLPRDLETICLKAMAKEPDRRYQTARHMADDLRHWLNGEPIQARPVGAWERAWVWARRRPAVAALLLISTVAVLALGMVATGSVFYAQLKDAFQETKQAKEMAEAARMEAERYKYFHHIALAQAEWSHGNLGRARQLLDDSPRDQRGWEWACLDRLFHGELLTLPDHTGYPGVNSVAFSPDGIRLAAAGKDHVKVWDACTGRLLQMLQGHKGRVNGVAFSPDGRRLASTSADGTLKVWDVTTGQGERTINNDSGELLGVAFSPDGARLAAGGRDKTVMVCEIATGQRLYLRGHSDQVRSVAFSPDGTRLASASDDGLVMVWDATTGGVLYTRKAANLLVLAVAFSPDGTRLAAGGDERTVRVWDVASGSEVFVLRSQTGVQSLAFSPDGRWMATGSGDRTVRIWDLTTRQESRVFRGHISEVWSMAFSPDGTRLVSASGHGTLKVWDVTTTQEPLPFPGHADWATCVAFSPDGTLLASSCKGNGTVKVWDTATRQLRRSLQGHSAGVWSVAFSPDGTLLASASEDRTVRLWDVATGRLRSTFTEHTGKVSSVKFSPDSRRVASATGDVWEGYVWEQIARPGEVKIWDVHSLQVAQTLLGHTHGIVTVAFSPDGARLASASQDGTGRVWDTTTGKELFPLQGHTSSVTGVAFSPDGSLIASGSWDGTVKVWDGQTGALLQSHSGHNTLVNCVAFSPDGARLASGSGEHAIKIWDVKTGQEVFTLRGHTSWVWSLVFSPDGTRLAAANGNGTLRIWDTRPWTPAAAIEREALGLLDSLFAMPLCKADVLDYLQNSRTIRPEAQQLTLSLVDRYREETDPEKYHQASWAIVRQPYLNAFQYRFALQQAETACRLAPDQPKYQATLSMAQYRVGQKEEAQATLALLRETLQTPEWAKNEEAQTFLRDAASLIEGKTAEPQK